ncbi:MAG: FtsX-like permease family protein [Roseivirga sp.]|nr:FtsX-like permease family protein [Roseivirga sp.]
MLKRLGERLLSFYCHPDFQEDIKGDLEEYYFFNLEERGQKYASRKYLTDVVLLFRLTLLRDNWLTQNLSNIAMVKNNLKVAYRSMMRHKFYSFLNLSGLAVSIAASILIAIFVQHELSYDSYHQESDKVYRIATHLKFGDNEFRIPAAPAPMAKTLKTDYPEIRESGRWRSSFTAMVEHNNQFYNQSRISYVDQSMFNILTFDIIRGDMNHFLDEPNTTVLTQTVASKIFGQADPIGKVIRFEDQFDLKVTGVIADIPDNSHFRPQMMISMLSNPDQTSTNWLSNNYMTYLKLSDTNDPQGLYDKFPSFIKTHFSAQIKQFIGATLEQLQSSGSIIEYQLQPIERIHLYSSQDYGIPSEGSIQYVYIFSIIGFFILLIACINFMNLATARASIRAKEVGVRKVLGSLRKQLINQFLTEAVLSSVLAFSVAIGIVYLVLPYFNEITDKAIVNPVFGSGGLWPYLIISCLVVGLSAGLYPAFVLSGFSPVKVLKGETTKGKSGVLMRNILVVIQFTTSIFLIISSLVVYNQLSYLQTKELGFNKDQILIINETQVLGESVEVFKNRMKSVPGVMSATVSSYLPAVNIGNDFPLLRADATSNEEAVSVQNWDVDPDYAETYDLEIVEGRFFSEDMATDSMGIILNETALKRFGYTEDPIGKKIKRMGGLSGAQPPTYTIVGVIKDFHFRNMTEVILPQAMYLRPSTGSVSIKFAPEQALAVQKAAGDIWSEMSNGRPYDYNFMDDLFANQFQSESRVQTIFTIFASLAIVIACLGLFGLSAYVTEQRKKEIGIRKVLGASMPSLIGLLFSSFNKLVLISAVLAIPVAYFFMEQWLADFSYQISLNVAVFIIGALGTFLIAWFTVGFQSLKAARRNPVENLRTE